MKAAEYFGLRLQDGHGESDAISRQPMGIWNGALFVFQSSSSKYWDIAKMLFRYGRSPLTARKLVRNAIQSFLSLYGPAFASKGPLEMSGIVEELGFGDLLQTTALTTYTKAGVSPKFVNEIISAATSVNYAQSAFSMHGVGGLVSMAASGATSVQGGNKLIFERFGAHATSVRLESRVTRLVKTIDKQQVTWTVEWEDAVGSHSKKFDDVIVAAPFHSSGIEIVNSDAASLIPPIEYVQLHVTIVITNASTPQLCFFDPASPCSSAAPPTIYTALDDYDQGRTDIKPLINSLNYLKAFDDGTFAVKLFSPQTLSASDLDRAFGRYNTLWRYEKVWHSYPYLRPIDPSHFAPIKLDQGLYYPSAFEAMISTMETATVSAVRISCLLTIWLTSCSGMRLPIWCETSWAFT